MYPQGVSRICFCSLGCTHNSGVRFWNLTASAPFFLAVSIRDLAISRLPLWLIPISATTNVGFPSPTFRFPIIISRDMMIYLSDIYMFSQTYEVTFPNNLRLTLLLQNPLT